MSFFKKLFGNSDKRPVKYSTDDYNRYFDSNTFNGTTLEFLPLGKVALPTGQIIAADPLTSIHERSPFNRTVKPGNYSVTACIAKTEKSGDRYAVVKLEFNNTRPTKWELAVENDNVVVDLKEEDAYVGFSVDAGLGCFCDLQTQNFYNEFVDEFYKNNPSGNIYDDIIAAEFKKNSIDKNNPKDLGSWLNFQLPNKPDLNIVMFDSGYGDGLYPCYWGLMIMEIYAA